MCVIEERHFIHVENKIHQHFTKGYTILRWEYALRADDLKMLNVETEQLLTGPVYRILTFLFFFCSFFFNCITAYRELAIFCMRNSTINMKFVIIIVIFYAE